jgi:signal transduction histidine kinase
MARVMDTQFPSLGVQMGLRAGRWRPLASVSLRHRMSLAMAAFLVAILGITLLLADSILTRTAEEAALGRLSRAAREVAATAHDAARQRLDLVVQAAELPEVHALLGSSAPTAEAVEAARLALGRAGVLGRRGTELWSADGRLLVRFSPSVSGTPPPTGGTEPIHGPLQASGDASISWTVAPVIADGYRRGWLASEMRLGGPGEAVRSLTELTGEELSLFTRNADGSFWTEQSGRPLSVLPAAVSGMMAGYELPGFGRAIAGEAVIGGTPWVVVMMTPLEHVHARAASTVWRLAGASLVLLLVGAILAWGFGAGLARPLVSLARAAEAMSAGDYTQRVAADGRDEVGRLALTFNRMAAQLEASRRELMQRVREAQDARTEAERMHSIAEYAREHAERASRAKGDFLAVVSHELRTPLNAIAGYSQLLELGVYGPLSPEQQAAMRRIGVNQEQLLALIDDVLAYAHLEARRVAFDIADVPLATVLGRVDDSIAPQLHARSLTFARRTADGGVTVRADAARLQQILLNLLSNAIKFTAVGGHITLFCDADASNVRIHVRDTGVGIPPDRLQVIFEPFVQVGRTHSNPGEGVGLGLAISRDLARAMGGDIIVNSVPGRGSVFTVVLPRGAAERPSLLSAT